MQGFGRYVDTGVNVFHKPLKRRGGRNKKKMAHTHTETLGLGDIVVDEMDKEKVILEKGGMNVTVTRSTVALALNDARATHAQLEYYKHQTKITAELLAAKMERAYVLESGAVDMMMAAVEKNSPIAKDFQRLRSQIRRANQNDAVNAEPLPVQDTSGKS